MGRNPHAVQDAAPADLFPPASRRWE
jgi:hypothetical protein